MDFDDSAKVSAAQRWDRLLAKPMFWLAAFFLVLSAGVLHRIGSGFGTVLEIQVIAWAMLIVWPIFLVEGMLRVIYCVRPDGLVKRLSYFFLIALAPPLRMGSRTYADGKKMWLPRLGACEVDRHLRKRLERVFSVPMMAIAVLVIPVLAAEYWGIEWLKSNFSRHLFSAQLALDIAESIIWMAFAAEFILMISASDKKVRYCVQNWMDLAIVLLPLVDFLPLLRTLRLTRVLELQQVTRLGRLYRLRGLLLKLWRAILLFDVLYRLIGNQKERRLQRLKELLTVKTEEMEDLAKEIQDLERELAASKAAQQPPPVETPLLEPIPVISDPPADPAGARETHVGT